MPCRTPILAPASGGNPAAGAQVVCGAAIVLHWGCGADAVLRVLCEVQVVEAFKFSRIRSNSLIREGCVWMTERQRTIACRRRKAPVHDAAVVWRRQ